MEIVSVKSLRRAALALMLGVSCHVQSAQVISLEMSLSATDINALVNRIPVTSSAGYSAAADGMAQPLSGLIAAAPTGLRVVAKDDAAFASAASTNGWLKGVTAPLLMLAGLLVLGLVRQQRGLRLQGAVAL